MTRGDQQENGEENGKISVAHEVFRLLFFMAVLLIVIFCIIHFIGQRTQVSGFSMKPTLEDGDNLIVDKISYRFDEPKRFDIIVFPYQHQEKTYYIKRIIGLPGETIHIKDGYIYINGEMLEEDYGKEMIEDSGVAEDPVKLKEDEYFVMGDNRNASSDSRNPGVGNIKRSDIIGRAWVRIWPFDKFGTLKHQ